MDPQELLKNILSSIYNHDREVVHQLRDLADWIEKGGIIPNLNKTRDDGYSPGVELPDIEFLPVCVICCKPIQPMESECSGCHTHCYDEMIREAFPDEPDMGYTPSRCSDCHCVVKAGYNICEVCWNNRADMGGL